MGSFAGAAEIYERDRHSYPSELRDHLVRIGCLSGDSMVVDLGAGTGQLSRLSAEVAASVTAIDPEPDMVRVGAEATSTHPNVRWLLGTDQDVLDLLDPPVDLVLIGNAFHHMNQASLLSDLDSLVGPVGAVVVCSSSIPVWLQLSPWSFDLRDALSRELGRPIGGGGTPDHDSDVGTLNASTFSYVDRWRVERSHRRSAKSIVGEVVSATSGAIDDAAAGRLLAVLGPHLDDGTVSENVVTTALIARRPTPSTRHADDARTAPRDAHSTNDVRSDGSPDAHKRDR